VVTDPQTHTPTNTQTHRQDRLQYTAPQLASAQCSYGGYGKDTIVYQVSSIKDEMRCRDELISV